MIALIIQIALIACAELLVPKEFKYVSGFFPEGMAVPLSLTMVPCAILLSKLISKPNRPYFYALAPALLGVPLASWAAITLGSLFFSSFQSEIPKAADLRHYC